MIWFRRCWIDIRIAGGMAATKLQGRGPSKDGIQLNSPTYFGACALGGIISCGPTHTGAYFFFPSKEKRREERKAGIVVYAPADRTTAVTPLDLVSPRLAFQWHNPNWSSTPAKTHFLSRSNVAVKLILRFTAPTSLHGEASLRKRDCEAFSLDGLQRSSATLFREPANMVFMKFLSTSTEIRCFQI